jgi:hypothetical protein
MAGSGGGLDDRLGSAAEALEEVRVVGIDHRAAPRRIGRDLDRIVGRAEQPWLTVVARRRERAELDQGPQVEHAIGRRPGDGALAACRNWGRGAHMMPTTLYGAVHSFTMRSPPIPLR